MEDIDEANRIGFYLQHLEIGPLKLPEPSHWNKQASKLDFKNYFISHYIKTEEIFVDSPPQKKIDPTKHFFIQILSKWGKNEIQFLFNIFEKRNLVKMMKILDENP